MNDDFPRFTHLLVLPHLRIQNANAVSSPLTHGFPSMTAFLGLIWALERKARRAGLVLEFNAVGVVSHDWQEQVNDGGFVKSFRLTRNPVDKDGSTAAIVEEGRIHLDLSLVIAVHAERWDAEAQAADLAAIADLLAGMRVAGGTVLPATRPWSRRHQPWLADFTGDSSDRRKAFREVCVRLLPGSALVARDDLIDQRLAQMQTEIPQATRLDAWLSLSRINWRYQPGEKDGKGEWLNDRKGQGWIVPIPVGYGALGEVHAPGSVANARDATTPFRFVESLYSVGEWVSPHRLQSPQQLLWYADSRPDDGLYRCRNDYRPAADAFEQLYDFD
ncbi:type I-F CRISPR-associated protein Csy2 [Pseudothauera rhizosphaerae]|uniref:Type I-F CRISPR-associated protein Csy2 n=1 Tax=Pseudothauera rhizosphaerae TaxID=2565932 RepID=A0A4V3WAL2_9RHOO|nr:type I-F CRISPR-associated protein Csy2 [Pseudothauera rhizosphaerae]THF59402.1 type I-F CRISPR-associated protein Csy2 [Pseudothauera rhizosphaerae]